MNDSSVTLWLDQLREGDSIAANALWDRYFGKLVALAHDRLRDGPTRAFDQEDVAVDVFDSVCRGIRAGRYPRLDNRDNLWRLLFRMTINKAADRQRHELRQRRGGKTTATGVPSSLDALRDDQPTPDMAAMMVEQYQLLLRRLDTAELQRIATLKLEGFTDEEIADSLGCVRRTVVRRLKLIREKWSEPEG